MKCDCPTCKKVPKRIQRLRSRRRNRWETAQIRLSEREIRRITRRK